MPFSTSAFVRTSALNLTSRELLTESVAVLLGVSGAAVQELKSLGIETIFDLASSTVFRVARELLEAAEGPRTGLGSSSLVPGDILDASARGKRLTELQLEPLGSLRGIGSTQAAPLSAALGVTNVRELGLWPPYTAARSILADAFGFEVPSEGDPEAPPDLIPGSGRYPTERVQYQVLVLDTVDDNELAVPYRPPPPLTHGGPLGNFTPAPMPADALGQPLETAGQVDLAPFAAQAAGFSKPAVGAILTYTQSWYAEGLSLGQLLHTIALAPGESTRIAMLDWSRRSDASTRESMSETEALQAQMERGRSLSEIVSAVAIEAQQGFSDSFGFGAGTQGGTASGGAGSASLSGSSGGSGGGNSGGPYKVAGGTGETSGIGLGVSYASGTSWTTGQRHLSANMAQKVMDRTHQASNSARNRWATIVREVSQSESERISTRTLTNYNHMHALSVEYFEIVQLYRVAVELTRVDGCLFVPMKLIDFTRPEIVARHKAVIAAKGLVPSVRFLAFSEPDTVLLTAPRNQGQWNTVELQQLASMFGESVGAPSSTTLYFPLTFYPNLFSSEDDLPFEKLVLEYSDGRSEAVDIQATFNPLFSAQLGATFGPTADKAARFWEVASVRAVKRKSQADWSGEATLALTLASLKPGSGAAMATLRIKIKVEASDQSVLLFEITRTVSGRDLRRHLMDNQLYYSQAIWRNLDAPTIGQMLSNYTFGGRPVLSQVDPLPVAAAGNFLVFRRHVAADQRAQDAWDRWLDTRDIRIGERKEELVPLPSGGVFAEAVLGRFNSAEKLDLTRFWNWQDSPIPITPTEIAAIQTGSRAQQEGLTPGQLSAPVLKVELPPNLPDPEGMEKILEAIQNGTMFRDMSGMSATIGFAQAALTRAFDAARDAGRQAGENMKTAADIYRAAFGGGDGGGSTARSGAPDLSASSSGTSPRTPSNVGGLLNYGEKLDSQRSPVGTSPTAGFGSPMGNSQSPVGQGYSTQAFLSDLSSRNSQAASGNVVPASSIFRNVSHPMGIDVSHHQGTIDWERVASSGISFAFIKASDGQVKDRMFQVNWAGAHRTGIVCGAYHFWRPQVPGKVQAQLLISQVGFHARGDLPPAIDVEDDSKSDFTGLTLAALEDNLQEFLDTVQAEFGVAPIVYTYPRFWKDRMQNTTKFSNYLLWISNTERNEPTLPGGWPVWDFWQWNTPPDEYRDFGRVDGITRGVDLDFYNGDWQSLMRLAGMDPKTI